MSSIDDNINSNYLNALSVFSKEDIEVADRAADHWYTDIGPNVIPADTKNKSPYILKTWKQYQSNPIPLEVFERWKQLGLFAYGIAVVTGNIWRGKNAGLCLNLIDADNLVALEEICSYHGRQVSLEQLASWTLVEQHKDNPNRGHVYILSTKPFPIKASDKGSPESANKIISNQIPGIEVKNIGGLAFAWNSIHEGGYRYEFVNGLDNVALCDEFVNHIDSICRKYSLQYLDGNGNGVGDIPIQELFNPETIIHQGNNRHKQQLRANDSLIKRLQGIFPLEKIKSLAMEYNKGGNLRPPLDDKEFEKLWKQSVRFIARAEDKQEGNRDIKATTATDDEKPEKEKKKRKVFIRKYTGNETLSLHESVVIYGQPSVFLSLTDNYRPQYIPDIETTNKILYAADTIDTRNPLPYVFQSTTELEKYLELARKETFETLYSKVQSIFKKYVNIDEHYITVLSADIIYSYFQDKFGTTHYNIFVGDNGSGKNSALLVFKYLGYRVFYVVSASAPNYFTFLGDIEEGQGSIAEDEAEGIGYDIEKQKVIKTGYCSGATVPKVDLSFGRTQGDWLTYCHKWFAMEELPDYKKIKGVQDRAFVYNFVVANVSYNIKDVMKDTGDPEFKSLHEELMVTRKLLFAFRMIHYGDVIPNIKLNIIHRNEELAKPLLRLFSYRKDSPIALDKIRLALSKFILGRNESKRNSIESKLLETIRNLIKRREEYKDEHEGKEYESFEGLDSPYSFYNDQIWAELKDLMDGKEISGKPESFYSTEYGAITHKRITGLYKSKLKADPFRNRIGRGLRFSKDVLNKLDSYYNVPDEIVIQDVTHGTDVTDVGLDRYAAKAEDTEEITEQDKKGENNSKNNRSSTTPNPKVISEEHIPKDTNNPSQVSQASPLIQQQALITPVPTDQQEKDQTRSSIALEDIVAISKTIYRISPHSDIFGCNNCKLKGDKWEMRNHACRGLRYKLI